MSLPRHSSTLTLCQFIPILTIFCQYATANSQGHNNGVAFDHETSSSVFGSSPKSLDLTQFTDEELQDVFGVTEHQNIPNHITVAPQTERGPDGHLSSLRLRIDDGTKLHLPLRQTLYELFAEDFVELHHDMDGTNRMLVGEHGHSCHYQSSFNNTHAAISNCDGSVRGLVIHEGEVHVVQPVPVRHSQYHQQHIIYKRSIHNESTAFFENQDGDLKNFCGSDVNLTAEEMVIKDAGLANDFEDIAIIANRLTQASDLVVELGIFIDQQLWDTFVRRHSSRADAELKSYTATVVNSIQLIYKQATMMPPLTFKVTRYEVFKRQPTALTDNKHDTGNAQRYLDAFCRYQSKQTQKNYDHGFMLSGYDLHRGRHSRTISGIARLNGMCDSWNTCTLTEGTDFTSVFIGAHELGHSVGMSHDEPYCPSKYIMSASLGPGKTTWSSCSMRDYHRFIQNKDRRGRNCLRDSSHAEVISQNLGQLPGQRYTANMQCSMMHGTGNSMVRPRNDNYDTICYMMWCGASSWGRIITSHPALEGTTCRNGKWCRQGRCVPYTNTAGGTGTAAPRVTVRVNGQWSGWSGVRCSSCSCGTLSGSIGVLRASRTCTNPAPQNGGRQCGDDKTLGIVCSRNCDRTATENVETHMNDVCRDHRVSKRDFEITGEGTRFLKTPNRACKVFCKQVEATQTSVSYRYYGDLLPDGTPCYLNGESEKYCIDGECLPLACNDKAISTRERGCPTQTCAFTNPITISVAARWSSWSAWSYCSVTCGEGRKRRARRCTVTNGCSGSTEESGDCNEGSCPGDKRRAQWNSWSAWTSCSASCGAGSQSRSRSCFGGGTCPGQKTDQRVCDEGWCPWSQWSTCSRSCNTGNRRRSRDCPGGVCAGSYYDDDRCNTQSCSTRKEAAWSSWNAWSSCSITCGGNGKRQRSRSCNGKDCEKKEEMENDNCGEVYCPWSAWGACSVSCGRSGQKSRIRQCPYGGCKDDSNSLGTQQIESCYEGSCASQQRSVWKSWGSWNACSVTCGIGLTNRYRQCRVGANGHDCSGRGSETTECDSGQTCDDWKTWQTWSACSASCGSGIKDRKRVCGSSSGRCNGITQQTMTCNDGTCQNKGKWSTWSAWNGCSKTCAGGIKSRQRTCSLGKGLCGSNGLESVSCNSQSCSSSFAWNSWGPWSACSKTCDGGQKQRFRECTPPSACKRDRQLEDCNNPTCRSETLADSSVSGEWGSWSAWSSCSQACGQGTAKRRRSCQSGSTCTGDSSESKTCEVRSCAEWGGWGHWGSCSTTCGNGVQRRIRNCYGWGDCQGVSEQNQKCAVALC